MKRTETKHLDSIKKVAVVGKVDKKKIKLILRKDKKVKVLESYRKYQRG